ncbi:oligopeptide/dipeptide ABC transporter ATP-binding protein [Pullulanibacillus pueri]|uniref:Oligopeptide transport ATP-binding protein AppF n=1 Tax=Pullulanibacillus pueri TaxID=1437324 RepID=A0A8J3EMB3_9BACL|nr:oligopeptide/dipeptide ABC transporter ATP-binding protein [Pullulanibacillus pueri]MBM7682621.1 oligopeptide/dipeptide ABC transporter ATP-binding protein [Pullulanibacillus pueri]GGH82541.1 oligopeptide transport ATP-binding protein AppF [Pullulanibacillus pueri]
MNTILEVKGVSKSFPVKGSFGKSKGAVSAVSDVSFSLKERGTLGIVGESGCGKSTLARLLLRLIEPDEGEVLYRDQDILTLKGRKLNQIKRKIQMVFQNPYSSINPKMTIENNVAFSLWTNGVSKKEARKKANDYLEAVGLPRSYAHRYPQSLSGGQRQRVAIARALVLEPEIIIADEAVSALDKSIQGQVLNLFQDLKKDFNLSLLFISHDLNVVEYMSDEVMVMYLGKVVEKGSAQHIYSNARHPYTKALLNSEPSMKVGVSNLDKHQLIKGELPSPLNPPSGCRFRTRCPHATAQCGNAQLPTIEVNTGHHVACHLWDMGTGSLSQNKQSDVLPI